MKLLAAFCVLANATYNRVTVRPVKKTIGQDINHGYLPPKIPNLDLLSEEAITDILGQPDAKISIGDTTILLYRHIIRSLNYVTVRETHIQIRFRNGKQVESKTYFWER